MRLLCCDVIGHHPDKVPIECPKFICQVDLQVTQVYALSSRLTLYYVRCET